MIKFFKVCLGIVKKSYHSAAMFFALSVWWLLLFFLGCGRDVVYAVRAFKKGNQ